VKVIDQSIGNNYALYHGDSCEVIKGIPDNSIGYTITSPPFSSLYTYSASDRDIGNCSGDDEFFTHFQFLIKELYRVTMPGRLLSLHCMNLPSTITHNGYIGIRDFRGDLIRGFSANGWIYHSEVCIWKDPVIAMQRTKAIGLLHKQLCKDSSLSRQGIPDYLVTMRKPGKNESPISGKLEYFAGEEAPNRSGDATRDSINIWQRYASPVWMDINPTRTLQYTTAKDSNDERHITPLQLDVIERGIQMWSNSGDVVLDPFNGIGSTGFVALNRNRKYIGIELKDTYFEVAKQNLCGADSVLQQSLF
jgi:DNA modification methylase